MGDKTQLATSAIGVLPGSIDEEYLHYAAGAGFIIIGIWTLWKA